MNDGETDKARLQAPERDADPDVAGLTSGGAKPIGYRRPPAAFRFKPGQSGNPSGRPKVKGSVGAIVQKVMGRKISVTENGQTRRVSALEGMLQRMRADALRGDKAALKFLLLLYERYAEPTEGGRQTDDLLREDLEILAKYGLYTQGAAGEASPDVAVEPASPKDDKADQ